ncbi:MAG: endospore germination permease [Bacillota bacterium]|nr:endospore germination permease [Bacillota bacterium]
MREDWGLSDLQLLFLSFAVVAPTAILTLPRALALLAGQDGWLAALLALPAGLIPLVLLWDLDRRYPGQTFTEQARQALGPLLGRVAAALAVLLFALLAVVVTREVTDAVHGENLPRTPLPVVVLLVLLAPVSVLRQGIETLARWAEILLPIGLVLLFLLVAGSLRDLHPDYLLPVLGHGWTPIWTGAVQPASFYAKVFALAYVLPFRGDGRKGAFLAAAAGLFAGAVLLALTAAVTVALFGPLAASLPQPVFEAARMISVAEFLAHLDAVAVAAWLALGLTKLALVAFAFVFALADLLQLEEYRPLTLPGAALTGVLAAVEFRSTAEFQIWVFIFWPWVALALCILLPFLVWSGAVLRGRSGRRGRTGGTGRGGRPGRARTAPSPSLPPGGRS